ncbi:MAG TPA: glycosyltransferase [Polyangiaceae bacterium LLY-WYZ-15_(1-7)]|nr:glycosyltransferase [Polyangiaceae bacterium LLY-WYZ-15_(1-7)]HJL12020.1 glycosyltransferase [Polyangiaceae bacterium LLY-WYZ-15_(1-7)]HJL24564.1 glycosyltransferase [Polyangiaceae bacterium LLY-WYZ-15_(1-7)]HJL39394.1 glycosyltransferase [Polyangiaceae bacterium LLY-WYZ-15_(1-7)]
MRTLHLACLPFPSPQGTQGVLRAMLDALGSGAHLLTYGWGAADGRAPVGWTHHRLRNVPRMQGLRSGPSLGKVLHDAQMIGRARALARGLAPDLVVAHNVEAALVARAAGLGPRVYYAHTRFDAELPTYAPSLPGLGALGAALDRVACGADAVVAITPALAAHLGAEALLPPWPTDDVPIAPRPHGAGPRSARPAVLYAGNLDGYQGWEDAAEATRRAGLRFLVATASDPAPLARFPHAEVRPLATEADRRGAHAEADLVVVPRRAPGGLPIKLLDALARDVPVVATRRALAGLDPAGVRVAADDDPAALARSLREALAAPPRGGRAWVEGALHPARFREAMETLAQRLR